MTTHPKLIYGAFPLSLVSKEEVDNIIAVLKEKGVNEWDTARIYPGSETAIGSLDVRKDIIIDTKARGFEEGTLSREAIIKSIGESLEELHLSSVETYFLHSPDPKSPIEETIDTINELYEQGKFKRFGLSNFTAQDVKKIYEYAKSKGYVLPTVFQGNYNAFSRHIEEDLFPLLREYGISFYAYSPIGGGFLAKSVEQIKEGQGRFNNDTFAGQLYNKLYNRPLLLEGLAKWGQISEKSGIPRAQLAYRWIAFHSSLNSKYGDGIILGAKNHEQLSGSINAIKEGPLPDEVATEINGIWATIKDEAPINNYVF